MTASGLPIAARQRVQSVDVVRGLVMVLMALDHTRDFFTSVRFDPLDLTQTNPALFYTRWITHLCAPAFVFLSGTGAFLSTQRGKSRQELSRFLWTRGLWLIVLELTVVRLAWTFNFNYARVTFVQVIWALGWSMIVLAGLIRLPTWAITAFGLVMVAGHNLLDPITPEAFGGHGPFSYGFWGWLWIVLHVQVLPVAYPLIPWIGVMALGYVFGGIYSWDADKRRHFLWRLSALVIAGFVVLRYIDRYGDPGYWHPQASPIFTVMSFMNLQKYPPSLLYLMATLAPCFGLLALFERWSGPVTRFFMVYGKVPMFYYILHLYLIHALTLVVGVAAGFGFKTFLDPFFFYPPEWGYGLPVVYLAWAAVVLALYLPCRWFARVKATNRAWWLSYL